MFAIPSLRHSFVEELRHLHALENQLIELLPALAQATERVALALVFTDRLTDSKKHADRLEQIMDGLRISPGGSARPAVARWLDEARELLEQAGDPAMRDVGLMAKIGRIAHGETVGYRRAWALAIAAGHEEAADLLQTTLEEEVIAEEILRGLSQKLSLEFSLGHSAENDHFGLLLDSVSR